MTEIFTIRGQKLDQKSLHHEVRRLNLRFAHEVCRQLGFANSTRLTFNKCGVQNTRVDI